MRTPTSLLTAQPLVPWGDALEAQTRDGRVSYRFFQLAGSGMPVVAQIEWNSPSVPRFMIDMGIRYVITTKRVLDTAKVLKSADRGAAGSGSQFGSFLHAYITAGEATELAVGWGDEA